MKYIVLFIQLFTGLSCVYNQNTRPLSGLVKNKEFDKKIASLIQFDISTISVSEAHDIPGVIFLDAREKAEYEVSHLPGALFTGFDAWSAEPLHSIAKDQKIIVYCSVGYRSEKIAKKIKALGFTQVYNLYGGILEWANAGYVLQSNHQITHRVHTYNESWGKWLENKSIEKVY